MKFYMFCLYIRFLLLNFTVIGFGPKQIVYLQISIILSEIIILYFFKKFKDK